MMDMNETGNYFNQPNSFNTPNKQGKEKGERRLQNVVPVCVRQLRDFKGEEFAMFGMSSQIFTLVCILRDYDVSSTKATYTIEDHTGSIKAILWLENDSLNEVNLPPVKEGRYVRVYGSLRTSDGERTLLILKMFPVENINEITTHLLEVIHVRYATEKMSKEDGSVKFAQNNPSARLANTMTTMYDDENSFRSTFTPVQLKVHEALKNETNPNGTSRSTILSMFTSNQHNEVNNALDFLASEGHLYSTFDNDHFKVTD